MSTADATTVTLADDTTTAEILALEKRRHLALMAADTAALAELLDDSLVHVHAPGLTHSKAQLLEHVGTRQAYVEMRRDRLKVRLVGDGVAVVTGRIVNRLRSPDGSERVLAGMATQVLRRTDDGRWLFVSFQMTPDGEHVWPAFDSELEEDAAARASVVTLASEVPPHDVAAGDAPTNEAGER